MSDTDDTDVLLLIPPDFFNVIPSDSEDSFLYHGSTSYHGDHSEIERIVVNDLIDQVNELESRICFIESKENINFQPYLPGESKSNPSSLFDISQEIEVQPLLNSVPQYTKQRFSVSVNDIRHYQTLNYTSNSVQSTPLKSRFPLSLPLTPSFGLQTHMHCPLNPIHNLTSKTAPIHDTTHLKFDQKCVSAHKHAISVLPMTPSETKLISMPANQTETNDIENNFTTPTKSQNHNKDDLMSEIDDFLYSVKKSCPPAGVSTPRNLVVGTNLSLHTNGLCESLVPGTASDKHYESGEFTSSPNSEEIIVRSSKLTPEMHQTSFTQRRLELRDVDQLLDQMEATQLEIVQKLQGSGIPVVQDKDLKRKTNISVQKVANTGDNISSVPNLGFGVRELFVGHSTPPSPQKLKGYDTREPVEEDPIAPKTISPLGSDQISKSSLNVLTSDQRNIPNASSKHLSQYTSKRRDQISCFPETAKNEATYSSTRPIKTKTPRRKLDLSQNISDLPKCGYDFRKWYHGSQESYNQPITELSVTSSTNAIQSHQQSIPSSSFDVNSDTSKHAPIYQRNVPLTLPQFNYGPSSFTNNKTTYFETHSNLPNSGDGSTQTCSQTSKTKDYTNIEESLPSRLLAQSTTSSPCENKNGHTIVDLRPGKTQDFGTEGQKKKGTYSMDVKKEKLHPSTNVDPIVTQQRNTREGSTAIGSSGTHCKQDLKTSSLDEGYLTAVGPGQGSGTLLSLSELWGEQELAPVFFQDRGDHTNLASRLEEERYRRQHCEHLIVDLQGQLLQEHQKLAVAVKVDIAKDHAIARLQSAWTQLVQHWRELEEQRHNLANTLHLEREQYQQEMVNASKKVSRLEGELSQALDLAHGYKERSESSERERQKMIDLHMAETEALTAQLQEMRQHLDEASTEHSRIIGAREETEARLVASQQEVGKERSLKENVRKELQKIKQTLSNCEVELLALKEEKASLQLKMKEERNRISVVDQQKRSLQITLDEAKKREKSLRDELKASNDRLEKVKVDLRDYYQREVEVVVRTKLAEFQGQLDSAETSLRQELEAREKAVAEIAQKQLKQIADKHQLEIRLLEEKHHEEQQLLQLQVSQLQAKLSHLDTQRTEIVERLHGVMETQWKEALRVISGGNIHSRTSSDLGTKGQGKCELPKQPPIDSEEHRKHTSYAVQFAQQAVNASKSWDVPPLSLHAHQQSAGSSTTDDHPFCHEGQSTYRVGVVPDNSSGKLHSPLVNPGDELKRYIEMLLDRTPGKPLGEHLEVPTTDNGQVAPLTHWEHTGDHLESLRNKQSSLGSTLFDLSQGTISSNSKDNQTSKLPWK